MKKRSRSHKSQDLQAPRQHEDGKPKITRRRRRMSYPKERRLMTMRVVAGFVVTVVLLIAMFTLDFQEKPSTRSLRRATASRSSTTVQKENDNCRFDGSCPVRSTCAVSDGIERQGTCEAVGSKGPNTAPEADPKCLQACLKELQKDEHFYQERWPVVDWSEDVVSRGRPNGCLIVYHREPDNKEHWNYLDEQDKKVNWNEVPPSIEDWVAERFHHVKRVDPYNNDMNDNKWMAYCTSPCETDADCATSLDGSVPGFVCQKGACLRNANYYWRGKDQANDQESAEMVLVTGATSGYFRGLTNLAASARYWAPKHKLVVYNLGDLTPDMLETIRGWSNVLSVEWPRGVPRKYPHHVHQGKKYAWKPIIVNETVHKYKSIFWVDAGSTLTGSIEPVENIIQQQGIMLMKGQDLDMRGKSSEKTYEWFGFDKSTMETGPHFSGNTQAFLHPSRYTETIVIPNAKCALDENCIAPPGSALNNHRYDQRSISILGYHPKTRLPHYTEYLAAEQKQLKDLSQASFKIVWTARQLCYYYANRENEAIDSKQ